MPPEKKSKLCALTIMLGAFLVLGAFFLSGCSSFGPIGLSFETQYGRFSYQLPDVPSPRTLNDKR